MTQFSISLLATFPQTQNTPERFNKIMIFASDLG